MGSFQIPPIADDGQFEQLMADLLNENFHVISFKCFGKNGHRQKGIDVFSAEKEIVVQCKHKDISRNSVRIKRELLEDIESTIQQITDYQLKIHFNTLIIATTASESPDFDEYVEELRKDMGLTFQVLLWGWESIQNKLSHSPETLSKHYPQLLLPQLQQETKVMSRIAMKKRIESDFGDWLNYSPENRKRRSRMIIHSSTDTDYPEHPNENGPWYWFAAEIARISTRGLGFYTGGAVIYLDDRNYWTAQRPSDPENYQLINVSVIEVVDFNDIVDYDLAGDEHYNCPHFYMRFNEENTPFTEVYYEKSKKERAGVPLFFDSSMELTNHNSKE